ncbi:MAG TPA: PRC-barrel domain-containing protein [Allosphingosinicella sp.]|nr:PRC-barrel domain-containing protein [Allosphingosinicella sp.]
MHVSKHMHHDHAELRSLAEDILKASDGGDVGGRDNQFDLYDIQVRRHLAVVEEVMCNPLRRDEQASDSVADIMAQHKIVRRELSSLDRANKGTPEWTSEFRHFTEMFDSLCARHDALVQHAERLSSDIGDQYEQAKLRRMRGGQWSWNRVSPASPLGIAAGVAAVAGAAYAANRYFKSGRRSSGRSEDDFELRLETDENLRLISSSKVEGTPVVDRDGAKIGTITSFMVDKYTGRVAYAVMSFGGTMGMGASLFPLPWPVLDYDENAGGYMLDISKEEMKDAPRFEKNDEPEFSPEYRRTVLMFYRPGTSGTYSSGSSPDSWNASTSASGSSAMSGSNAASTAASDASPRANPAPTSVG